MSLYDSKEMPFLAKVAPDKVSFDNILLSAYFLFICLSIHSAQFYIHDQ